MSININKAILKDLLSGVIDSKDDVDKLTSEIQVNFNKKNINKTPGIREYIKIYNQDINVYNVAWGCIIPFIRDKSGNQETDKKTIFNVLEYFIEYFVLGKSDDPTISLKPEEESYIKKSIDAFLYDTSAHTVLRNYNPVPEEELLSSTTNEIQGSVLVANLSRTQQAQVGIRLSNFKPKDRDSMKGNWISISYDKDGDSQQGSLKMYVPGTNDKNIGDKPTLAKIVNATAVSTAMRLKDLDEANKNDTSISVLPNLGLNIGWIGVVKNKMSYVNKYNIKEHVLYMASLPRVKLNKSLGLNENEGLIFCSFAVMNDSILQLKRKHNKLVVSFSDDTFNRQINIFGKFNADMFKNIIKDVLKDCQLNINFKRATNEEAIKYVYKINLYIQDFLSKKEGNIDEALAIAVPSSAMSSAITDISGLDK